jgi:hypothetical protein
MKITVLFSAYMKPVNLYISLFLLLLPFFFFFYFMHLSFAASQILLIHLFLGWPMLLFPVGLYDSVYRGKRL